MRARIAWHCRRGIRELDLLLERFLADRFDNLSDARRQDFERFLDEPNENLERWLLRGDTPPDKGFAWLVEEIRRD